MSLKDYKLQKIEIFKILFSNLLKKIFFKKN